MRPTTAALLQTLRQTAAETGVSLRTDLAEVATYAEQQGERLLAAQQAGEPGLDAAVLAARDAIATHAGMGAVHEEDALFARVRGVIHGFLTVLLAGLA